MRMIRRMWTAAPIATAILGLALVATAFFAVRLVAFWIYWSDPAHRDQVIEPWMTPRYVAHSWHVPREVMVEALGQDLEQGNGGPPNLARLAAERGVTTAELITVIEAAIEEFRATTPRPGGGRND